MVHELKYFNSINFIQLYISEERLYDCISIDLLKENIQVYFDLIFIQIDLRFFNLFEIFFKVLTYYSNFSFDKVEVEHMAHHFFLHLPLFPLTEDQTSANDMLDRAGDRIHDGLFIAILHLSFIKLLDQLCIYEFDDRLPYDGAYGYLVAGVYGLHSVMTVIVFDFISFEVCVYSQSKGFERMDEGLVLFGDDCFVIGEDLVGLDDSYVEINYEKH